MKSKSSKKVLVVDDNKDLCGMLKERFEEQNRIETCPYIFEVDIAYSAKEMIHG